MGLYDKLIGAKVCGSPWLMDRDAARAARSTYGQRGKVVGVEASRLLLLLLLLPPDLLYFLLLLLQLLQTYSSWGFLLRG